MLNKKLSKALGTFAASEDGAVAVEYVLIAAAMFTAIIPAFLYVASGIGIKFSSITGYFSGT
jgi:Flp pilus assembly pilin Flp